MKHLLLLLLSLGLLLSGCQPRDVKVVPEGERAKGKGRVFSRETFLGNYAMGTHLLERQIEILMAEEMLNDNGLAESQGYSKLSNGRERSLVRSDASESLERSKNLRDVEQWTEKNDSLIGSSSVAVFLNGESQENPTPILKIAEVKKAKIKRQGNTLEVDYIVTSNLLKGSEAYVLTSKIKFTAHRGNKDGAKGFVIENSSGTFEAKKNGDARYSRTVAVQMAEGFFVAVNGCSYAEGTMTLNKIGKDGMPGNKLAELIVTKEEIKENSQKKNAWSEKFLICGDTNSNRPVIDFHRLLR